MNTELFLGALGASFVGSLHCAGMCGPLVVFAGAGERPSVPALAAYHGARIAGYVLLGVLAGSLGAALDLGAESMGLGRVATVLAGGTMVLIGLGGLLGAFRRARVGRDGGERRAGRRGLLQGLGERFKALERRISARVMPLMGRATRLSPLSRSLWIGGLTALLPCGWLFAFLVVAAGTGSPWSGALVMVMLGLGSVPVLLGIGVGSGSLLAPLARRSRGVVAALLLALGVLTVSGRLSAPSFAGSMQPETLQERLLAGGLADEALPCCSTGASNTGAEAEPVAHGEHAQVEEPSESED